MPSTTFAIPMALALLLSACPSAVDDDDVTEPAEILTPEPVGAPTGVVDGRLTCLGDNDPGDPIGGAVELTGYARSLDDPTADEEPPEFDIEVFGPTGNSLRTGFSLPGNDGRVTISVPIDDGGFDGYAEVSADGFVDLRFQSSRPVTTSETNGWGWLATQDELDAIADGLGTTLDPSMGILVGSSHDCDSFGMDNVVIVVDGATDGIFYVEGFEPVDGRTYTASNGRFAMPDVDPGTVLVKAFGRLEAGGPLTLLSSVETEVSAGGMTGVALEPRVGNQ